VTEKETKILAEIARHAKEGCPVCQVLFQFGDVVCVWCGEGLIYNEQKGWVHKSDGEMYKKNPDGSDNHCALPKRS
jgi:hypothetical protein